MKDDIVQLLTKIFSKIISPFLSKNALYVCSTPNWKNTAYLSVINPYLQKPHLFNIIKGNSIEINLTRSACIAESYELKIISKSLLCAL